MREQEVVVSRPTWFEMSLMDEEHQDPDHNSTVQVATECSNSEGAIVAAEDVDHEEGASSKSTSLAKREC